MSETGELIKATLEKLTKLEIALKHSENLKQSLESMGVELNNLNALQLKELEDVEKLEQVNISSLFHKVLGNKDEQLDKERQEYLAVTLKIKELKKSIDLTQFELGLVEKKVLESDQLKNELNTLKEKREKEIIDNNHVSRLPLLNLHSTHDGLIIKKNEIVEAHNQGRVALSAVELVLRNLNEAIQNGEWDMYSRTGYHDYYKHKALDRASEETYKAQIELSKFNKELLDIGIYEQTFHLNLNQISKFTDMFFDNLITDWINQKKIKNSFATVDSLRDKIRLILDTLESEFKDVNAEIEKVKLNIDDLVLNS